MHFGFAQYKQSLPIRYIQGKQKGSALIFLLVGIVILLIGGGAFYLGRSTLLRQDSAGQTTSKPSPTPAVNTPQSASTTNETANWKTYTSNQIPVTFQYPPAVKATKFGGPGDRIPSGGYEFKEGGVSIQPLISKYEIALLITILTNNGDSNYEWGRIDQLYNVGIGESPNSGLVEFARKQDVIISNITAHSYENERSKYPTSASRLIVFKKDDSYYTIKTTYSLMADSEEKTKYSKIFDQILSTFKFTQ